MFPYLRAPRLALALSLLGLALPAQAQTQPAPAAPVVQTADDPWLYKGSDIIHDEAWKFGRLPNGLRYAVRKNGVPPGQVSIRVRMDVGSLEEQDSERGFAHLIEHLSFRGSTYVPDGDSKKIWQRLGVTFGSDSNAKTTFTETVYQLDLPSAQPAGIDESFRILSGMVSGIVINQHWLDAERPVVLAEGREQPGAAEADAGRDVRPDVRRPAARHARADRHGPRRSTRRPPRASRRSTIAGTAPSARW
ncbi:MAG: insulinase family protein [Sphingomonas sp.]